MSQARNKGELPKGLPAEDARQRAVLEAVKKSGETPLPKIGGVNIIAQDGRL